MIRYHMRLHPEPFRAVADGKKAYECRLHDEKRRTIRVGDEIEFENRADSGDRIVVVVETLTPFASFDEMATTLPDVRCGQDRSEWLRGLRTYYSEKDEKRFGTLAIKFRLG